MASPSVTFPVEMSAALFAEIEAHAARLELDPGSLIRVMCRQMLDQMNGGTPIIQMPAPLTLPAANAGMPAQQFVFGNSVGGDLDTKQKALA